MQISFFLDPARRSPEELLRDWPTLVSVASATADRDIGLTVVQAAWEDAEIERAGVSFRFVRERRPRVHARHMRELRAQRPDRLIHMVQAVKPDLLHVHGLGFPLETARLAVALPDVPILLQDHADQPPRFWKRPLYRRAFRRAAAVSFTARAQADPFVRAGVIAAELPVFEVLESSSHFTPGPQAQARAEARIFGNPAVTWIGDLSPHKDPVTALSIFAKAVHGLPDPHFWIIFRRGPLLHRLRERVDSDPVLRERVHFKGAVEHSHVQQALRGSDVFLAASHGEGSGYAFLESLACGTPGVVTDIPSFRRMVGNGAGGALYGVGDAEGGAGALLDVVAGLSSTSRGACRSHFEEELSFPALGMNLRRVYGAMLAGAGEMRTSSPHSVEAPRA